MPSVRSIRLLPGFMGLAASVGLLAGCATTQQLAARLRLNSAREVAAQTSTIVRRAGTDVVVTRVAVVDRSGASSRSAMVVSLTNRTARPISDLPISVGYILGAKRRYLNASANGSYFQSHLPLMAAHGQITWVFASDQAIPRGAHPFATVGVGASVPLGEISSTPEVSVTAAGAVSNGILKVRVDNRSGIPQYQLPVDAVGTHDGQVHSAGNTSVSYIGSGSIQTVKIDLAGSGASVAFRLEAVPTTFR